MALLPNTYVYGATGNNGSPVEKIGGVAIGITSATDTSTGSPITVAKTNRDMAVPARRNKPIQKTNPTGVYNATFALSNTGTFAYDATDWMVLRLGTTINGTVSNVLLSTASANRPRRSRRLKGWGAKTSSAFRANQFKWVGGLGQRTPWTVAPSSANADFPSTTNNGVAADDQALYVTFMAVPGELVYMNGNRHPFTDEYAEQTAN